MKADPKKMINQKKIKLISKSRTDTSLLLRMEKALSPRPATSEQAPFQGEPEELDYYIEPPVAVPTVSTPFGSLPFGFYLMYGPPAVGKTIMGMALALYINSGTGAKCAYKSVSEPRSNHESKLAKELSNLPAFVDPYCFEPHVRSGAKAQLSVVDSVGYAMRSYSPEDPKRGASGSMEQGMDVADQAFCRQMQAVCMKKGVLIGIVGNTEVPFVELLEGLVEGLIKVEDTASGSLEFKFRGSLYAKSGILARTPENVIIPSNFISSAAKILGYS